MGLLVAIAMESYPSVSLNEPVLVGAKYELGKNQSIGKYAEAPSLILRAGPQGDDVLRCELEVSYQEYNLKTVLVQVFGSNKT